MTRKAFSILLLTLVSSLSLFAQESTDSLAARLSELEARIAQIEGKGATTELGEIKQQIEVLTKEIEALKIGEQKTAVIADVQQFGLGAAASKVYRSEPGLSFGGYGEFLYENFDAGNRVDQLDVLRAILYSGYKFSDRVIFNSELEFEHATTSGGVGEVSVEFGYLDFMIRPELNVRAGLMLMPVGLVNELHEPTAFLGAKRPEVERTIIPSTWREAGAGIFGDIGSVTYRAYVVTGLDSADFSSSGIRAGRQGGARAKADDFALVGRLDWEPVEGLLVGGSLFNGNSAQGRAYDGQVTITELHADAKIRGISARALWSHGTIDDVSAINAANNLTGNRSVGEEFGGWYGELGYDLASVLPLRQQSLTPYIRFESFDSQAEVPSGFTRNPERQIDITTFGFAWKPIAQSVIKFDVQNVENEAGTGVDQFNLSLGYIF